ncbi:MAG: PGF-pre-PGF domain-containing protein [Methanosarcina sp.]
MTATVTSGSNPSYSIEKTVTDVAGNGSSAHATKAGDVIDYEITVENTGNVALTGVFVNDSLISSLPAPEGDNSPVGTLDVEETWVYTPTYTVTQEDLNNKGGGDGDIDNTATVDCDDLDPQNDSETVILDYNPAYSINKSISDVAGKGPDSNVTVAGNVITYKVNVTNDGNIDLTNVSFNDPLLGSPQLSESNTTNQILEPGEKWTYTGTYTVVQADIVDNGDGDGLYNGDGDGIINNTASVDCTELESLNASAEAQIDQTPYLVNKTIIDVAGKGPEASATKAGDVITYQINLTNYGGLPFKLVSVYDSLSLNTLTGPMESGVSNKVLDPGENWLYTGNYTVTQADLNTNGEEDGFINNTAIAYFYGGVKPNDGFVGFNSSSAAVPVVQNPAYSINKTVIDAAGNGPEGNVTKAGDIISYQINVTNDGNLDLTNVTASDSLVNLTGPVESLNSDGVLNPGENWTYTGNYTVIQADITDNGNYQGEGEGEGEGEGIISNTATVYCDQLEWISDSIGVQIDQTPYLINKTVIDVAGKGSSANATKAGDLITYRINLTNYGGLPFKPVSVHDSLIALTGPTESHVSNKVLDPGENWTFTGTYTIAQADLNSNGGGDGFINNTATAFFYGGLKPANEFVGSKLSSAEVPVEQNPAYSINKTVIDVAENGSEANATKAGDIITYQINVTNTGNIDLANITVSDPLIKLEGHEESMAEDGVLNPEENWIYTGTYEVTQEDLNSNGEEDGFINNTATVDCDLLDPKNDSANVPLEWNPAYSINKTVIDVDGKGSEANATSAGDVITYQVNVTNDGNIDLTNVNVSDSLISLEDPVGDEEDTGILNVGENWNYTGTYTVTQTDLNSNGDGDGFINNTASIVCDQLEQESSSAAVQVEQNPAYNVSKTVADVAGNGSEANVTNAGDIITYEVNVSNEGNIDLTNISVSDSLFSLEAPAGDEEDSGILNVGENWIYTANYTVSQADMNSNGDGDEFINNTVIIACDQLEQENDSAAVPIEQNPAYTINKTVVDVAGNGSEANVTFAGDIISYQVNVTNDGNIGLNNVTASDSLIELSEPSESTTADKLLELGETWTYYGNYTVTQADLNDNGGEDGFINNTATVDCDELDQENGSADVFVEQNPAYGINKTVTDVAGKGPEGNVTSAGDVISYQINLTNEGNIDLTRKELTNETITDSLFSLEMPIQTKTNDEILEVGETWIFIGNYTVIQADLNSNGGGDGFINNTAAIYSDELGLKNDSAEVPVEQNPAYSIDKTVVDVAGKGPEANVTSAGDVIGYQVNVTNNGNIDLNNVSVSDSLINLTGPIESKHQYLLTQSTATFQGKQWNGDGILEVGETWTYIGTYNVTQADLNSNGGGDGFINNTATVDCDDLDPTNDSAEVPVEQNFDCSFYKSIIGADNSGDSVVDKAGDVIEYRLAVKNEGNVDLTDVLVNDPLIQLTEPDGDDTDPKVLNVGETWKFYGNYTVTQDDINCNCGGDGFIDNTATVSCNELQNESFSVKQPIVQSRNLIIYKSLLGVDNAGDCIINKAGDIIEYQISVKNNGKVDLTGVSVSDPLVQLAGPVGDDVCPGVLNVGETWKYTGNYTVTQDDISSNGGGDGDIDNTATVRCNKLSDKTSSVEVPIILPRNIVTGADSGSNNTNGTDSEDSGTNNGNGDGASSSGGSSGSSSGSSGGAGGSPEPAKNIEVKELSQAFVTSGNPAKFNFPKNATSVTYITFDTKKTAGKTTTIVEMLKGKSTLVSDLPSGELYKSFNIWVGNSGFATSKNIENAVIGFKVEKSWMQDKGIDRSSIVLNRYSDSKWSQLSTSLSGEDDGYMYFTAETPGFSPFAVTSKTAVKESGTEMQSESSTAGIEENTENTADVEQQSENEGNTSKGESTPGFEMIYGIAGFFAVSLYRRK